MWSWKFLPTPGRSCTTGTPTALSSSAGPMPESSSSRGEFTAPLLKINSRSTRTVRRLALDRMYSSPMARPFSIDDLAGQRLGLDGEVLPAADRLEIGGRGALPAGVLLGDVVPADALLYGAVEVAGERHAELLGGPDERLAERVVLDLLGDVHRADAAVVAVVEPLVGLGPAEERQHLLVAPVLVAELRPRLVVLALAADVDHRVDRGAAAQGPALRVPHRPVVQLRLRHRRELPVVARAAELGEPDRHVHQRGPVAAAGLEQQHRASPGRRRGGWRRRSRRLRRRR